MLITLQGRHLRALSTTSRSPFLARISERRDLPEEERARSALVVRGPAGELPAGFRGYLLHEPASWSAEWGAADVFHLAPEMRYLTGGDVVRIDPLGRTVRALYRRSSQSNALFVTERCDNYCVMCSQPPKARDDSWLVDEVRETIPLISPDTRHIGVTGGEPALLGERLVALARDLERHLPRTAVHVLSNGRRFADASFARSLARAAHHDLTIGVPLYSDVAEEHDYVVQARGAFSQTIRGILNLKQHGVKVEVRFVVHADTYARLPDLARFVARNLLFVDHVAIMGLELVGFAKTNLEALWIDPLDYAGELAQAVATLQRARMAVSIYNHPLCALDARLHPLARKSISDWKNAYFEECDGCAKRDACGGFFASSVRRRSRGIRRFAAPRWDGRGDAGRRGDTERTDGGSPCDVSSSP